jgi:Flp pilus assembly protein TadG
VKRDRLIGGFRVPALEEKAPTRRARGESGQATVEFALILIPFLILVVGIIQFGIGLNFWLDQQRIANQGARWAVVNSWPGCDRAQAANTCTATPACTVNPPANTTLVNYLKCQTIANGLRNNVLVTVCYPNDGDAANDGLIGSPVRVQLDSPYSFRAIMKLATINLRARADMRLEANTIPNGAPGNKGHLSGVGACP